LIIKRSIGSSELDQAVLELLDASAAPDGLVIDPYPLVRTLEVADPPGHDRIDECATRARKGVAVSFVHREVLLSRAAAERESETNDANCHRQSSTEHRRFSWRRSLHACLALLGCLQAAPEDECKVKSAVHSRC